MTHTITLDELLGWTADERAMVRLAGIAPPGDHGLFYLKALL